MINLIFETQGQTFDDESGVVSGWSDVRLTPLGIDQAKQIGTRYNNQPPDAVLASDLKRASQSVEIAFDPNPHRLFTDWRLRECNYGDLAQALQADFATQKMQYLSQGFPNGESYVACVARIASVLKDIQQKWAGKTVLIIGDQTTFYALEYLIKGVSLEQSLAAEWQWQAGWRYEIQ